MMKNAFKKAVSVLVVAAVVFSAAPLAGLVGLELPEFNLFGFAAEELPKFTSGPCGDNLTWNYDKSTGEFVVSGTGAMWDYDYDQPWEAYKDDVLNIVIGDGVTSIGAQAFAWFNSVVNVTIPDNVTSIGSAAFHNCVSLESVSVGSGLTSVGDLSLFTCCYRLERITVDPDNTAFSNDEHGVMFNKDKTELIKYPEGNKRTTYEIPSQVKIIADNAFHGSVNLTDVTVPFGVTDIGNWAFDCCNNLTGIIIPDSVKRIGSYAFHFCEKITEIAIPASVTEISNNAFRYCTALESITVDKNNTCYSNDEYGVLFNKDKTTLVQYPTGNKKTGYKIPDGVIAIDSWAFEDCSTFTSITIPDSVRGIVNGAFCGCKGISSITIPSGVTFISNSLFAGCAGLTSVTIPAGITSIGAAAFSCCNNLTDVYFNGTKAQWEKITVDKQNEPLGKATVHFNGSEEDVTVPSTTKPSYTVATTAIYETTTNVVYPTYEPTTAIHTTTLPPEPISGVCGDNLTWTLDLTTGRLTVSGEGDMWDWTWDNPAPWQDNAYSVRSVKISDGVTSLGDRAFKELRNVENIEIPDSVTSIGEFAVSYNDNLKTVEIPDGVTTIEKQAFFKLSNLRKIEIPGSVTNIGEEAFYGCYNLQSVLIKNGVNTIAKGAFTGCSALECIHIPQSVTSIDENVLDEKTFAYICSESKDCYAKTYADENGIEFRICAEHREFPDVIEDKCGDNLTWALDTDTGVLTISGKGAMYDYTVSNSAPWYVHQPNITSVVIEDGATSIGNYAFTDLPNLKKVSMADSVETIGEYAFENCTRLADAEISENTVSIGDNAFYNCKSLKSATIPDSVKTLGSSAFSFCDSLKSIVIGDGLEAINGFCFSSCENLEYAEIGNNVTKIGGYAFDYCKNLRTVVLPKSLESIAAYAFDDCPKINSVYYAGSWEEWSEITFGYYNSNLLNASIYCNASADDVLTDNSNPDSSDNSLEWNLNKSSGTLYISGTGPMKDFSGNAFAPWYVYRSQIKAVIIGEGITSVGSCAFNDLPVLISVKLPVTITSIGGAAFRKCGKLETINLDNRIKEIGEEAFSSCYNLKTLKIPNSVTYIDNYAFSASGLENVTIGNGLKTIPDGAFLSNKGLSKLIIGESVESIGVNAFYCCSGIKAVFVPLSVTEVCLGAFEGCNGLTDVYYEGSQKDWESISFGYNNGDLIGATIHFGATADDVPDVEKTTVAATFVPTTVVTTAAEETTIPGPFSGRCGDNLSWKIDTNTNTLIINGTGPMWDFASQNEGWSTDAPWSDSIDYIDSIVISHGVTTVGDFAFTVRHRISSVTIPDTVTDIGYAAFAGTYITDLTVPDSVKTIDDYAFGYCYKLRSVTVPAGVTSISETAFYADKSIVRITVDEKNQHYSSDDYGVLFNKDKTRLIKYSVNSHNFVYAIPDSVETVCDGAFYAGYNLARIMIGDNVRTIGDEAFMFCEQLTDVYYKGTKEDWDKISVGADNEYLLKANIHFNATEDDFLGEDVAIPTTTERPSFTVPAITKVPSTTSSAETTTRLPETTTSAPDVTDVAHTHTPKLVVVNASCTVNGMKYTVCRDCGEPIGETTVIVASHKLGEWETVAEATTESEGKRIIKCTVCGETLEEEIIPKLSRVVDEKTGISIDYTAEDYDGTVEISVKETFDGTAFDIVDTSVASSQKFICDIVMTVDGNETQPNDKVTVRIPLPEGYDYTRTFVYHVDTSTGNLEKMHAEYVDGYLVFETTHFSYYAVVEGALLEIRNPSASVIEYGNSIVLHADIKADLPEGWKIKWTASNGNFDFDVSDNGLTCTISPSSKGDTTFTATLCDARGNSVSTDEQVMTSKAGLFDKIIAFFRKLFGLTKTIPQVYKGIF